MTDEQWQRIETYITERLRSEERFSIGEQSFRTTFGLQRPFYEDMVTRARASNVSFEFDCGWKTASGDPAEPIRFWRAEVDDVA